MSQLEEFLQEWNASSPFVSVHTSGSTGKPKPVRAAKQAMLNSARITCDFLGLKPGDTTLLCMDLKYIGAKMMVVRSIERQLRLFSVAPTGHPLSDQSLAHASSVAFDSSAVGLPSPVPGLPEVVPTSFSLVAMVPLQVYNSLLVADEATRLRQIRHLIIGGGAVDNYLVQALKDFPNAVWSTYGMTETLSHVALRRLNGPSASEWYEPFDGVQIACDGDGCLVIDAPQVHDGWLVTNDLVETKTVKTADGQHKKQFRVLGRKDNVIVSGGVKIQIEEVEQSLRPFLSRPFAVSKRSDEKFGEVVVLVTEATDLADVSEICMNALPKYWVPRHYLHIDKIPLTQTGKIARGEVLRFVTQQNP
ncbi:AMP-binding protein [Prevotella sp. A2931]|uniref:AMP-binding protein n=1 Tax=Prevotella illustrans TaxID=2800387 RepID=A0ABS3M8D7_9BACT|nr:MULTISPECIES: AMP-binding protein [Prevotella]MBO1364437.1 AMP-binding protein [Prevotella illustrans]PTL25233.1 O-succinylbenzoic acid--CoA ligase [Prevotella sp. oral taxon 820]